MLFSVNHKYYNTANREMAIFIAKILLVKGFFLCYNSICVACEGIVLPIRCDTGTIEITYVDCVMVPVWVLRLEAYGRQKTRWR